MKHHKKKIEQLQAQITPAEEDTRIVVVWDDEAGNRENTGELLVKTDYTIYLKWGDEEDCQPMITTSA